MFYFNINVVFLTLQIFQEGILLTFKEIDAASLQICLENISVENLQNEKMVCVKN